MGEKIGFVVIATTENGQGVNAMQCIENAYTGSECVRKMSEYMGVVVLYPHCISGKQVMNELFP